MPQKSAIRTDRGVMDLPYLLLTLLLTAVGLIMLFSASFPRAHYVTGNSASYFLSQLLFAVLGIVAMYLVSRIASITGLRDSCISAVWLCFLPFFFLA